MHHGFGQEELESDRYPFYWAGVIAVASIALLIHLALSMRYGFFRDELYYLACTKHLAWGYVDHPPLCVFVLKLFTSILGENLWAVRLPGFLAGFASCLVFAQLARENGGSERAQVLAAFFAAFAPVIAVVTHLYSMNSLDILLWGLVVLGFLRAGSNEKPNAWIFFGLFMGLALMNKLSALLLLAALCLTLLLTHRRKDLAAPKPWIGLAITGLVVAPFVSWAYANNWIPIEFIRNATQHKMLPVSPAQFILTQIIVVNPLLFFVAMVGVWYGLNRRPFRPQALAFCLVFLVLILSGKSRENYLSPAYCLVIPIGAIVVSNWFENRALLKHSANVALVLSTAAILTFALPVLSPETFVKVTQGKAESLPAAESGKKSPLLGYADMFGWPEMAQSAKFVWLEIPQENRANSPVLGMNYGESAAVLHFNSDNQPPVIGVHNNFWIWGPGSWDGKYLVVVGELSSETKELFTSVEVRQKLDHPFAVPEEATAPISIAKGLKIPVEEFWERIKVIR